DILPPYVTDTLPVSSDTIIVNASVTSEIPTAALWRVPESFAILLLSDSGQIVPAVAILLPWMNMAPFARGECGIRTIKRRDEQNSGLNGNPAPTQSISP